MSAFPCVQPPLGEQCRVVQIPGPPGPAGQACVPCTDGANAYGVLIVGFTMPAIGGTVIVEVDSTAWMVPQEGSVYGQALAVQFAGTLLVAAVIDATHVELFNPGYSGNAIAGALIPIGARVGVSGAQGQTGITPGGALLSANNLADVASAVASRASLGLGSLATLSSVGDANWAGAPLAIANGGTGSATAAAARTALAAQTASAFLTGLAAAGPGAADQMAYLTAANTWALFATTATMRALLASATVAVARATLGNVQQRYGILGFATVNLDNGGSVPWDQDITMFSTRCIVRRAILSDASADLTGTAFRCGIYTGAGATGNSIVTTPFDPSALTAVTKWIDATMSVYAGTDVIVPVGGVLKFYGAIEHGVAGKTAKVWIEGDDLS